MVMLVNPEQSPTASSTRTKIVCGLMAPPVTGSRFSYAVAGSIALVPSCASCAVR